MTYSVLVSTSSFIDTPGAHVKKLHECGFEVVKARGPLNQEQLLAQIGDGNRFYQFAAANPRAEQQ